MSDVTHVIVKLTHPQPRRWMRFDDNYDDEYFGTAKELIMCKDCKHYDVGENDSECWTLCEQHEMHVDDDFFCKDGERKEE